MDGTTDGSESEAESQRARDLALVERVRNLDKARLSPRESRGDVMGVEYSHILQISPCGNVDEFIAKFNLTSPNSIQCSDGNFVTMADEIWDLSHE